jgi:hypothetical protein
MRQAPHGTALTHVAPENQLSSLAVEASGIIEASVGVD